MKKVSKASEAHKADLYYQRKYGVTLAEHEKRSEKGCEICGGKSFKRRLHADHSHKLKYLKVKTTFSYVPVFSKMVKWWVSEIDELGISVSHKTKNEAIRAAREIAKRKSYRGALCFPCNGGLRKFRDNPQFLENAAKYLRAWEAGLNER